MNDAGGGSAEPDRNEDADVAALDQQRHAVVVFADDLAHLLGAAARDRHGLAAGAAADDVRQGAGVWVEELLHLSAENLAKYDSM